MTDDKKKHRVVIVGAGFAGFNAARELLRPSAALQMRPALSRAKDSRSLERVENATFR
jgi:monoamine oxidase